MKKQPTPQEIQNTLCLLEASRNGDIDEVKQLLLNSNTLTNNHALGVAVENGHLDIVELLLPVSDPKAALKWSLEFNSIESIKLLIPYSDYNLVLTDTSLSKAERTLLEKYVNEYEVMQQQERLQASIEPLLNEQHSAKRKM